MSREVTPQPTPVRIEVDKNGGRHVKIIPDPHSLNRTGGEASYPADFKSTQIWRNRVSHRLLIPGVIEEDTWHLEIDLSLKCGQ